MAASAFPAGAWPAALDVVAVTMAPPTTHALPPTAFDATTAVALDPAMPHAALQMRSALAMTSTPFDPRAIALDPNVLAQFHHPHHIQPHSHPHMHHQHYPNGVGIPVSPPIDVVGSGPSSSSLSPPASSASPVPMPALMAGWPAHAFSTATTMPPPPPAMTPAGGGGSRRSAGASAPAAPRDFVCPSCQKRFTRAYNLKSHLKTHTHERPYVCEFCPKAFARKQDCLRHARIHTNDRPFVCARCSTAFARQDALSRHEYTCSLAANNRGKGGARAAAVAAAAAAAVAAAAGAPRPPSAAAAAGSGSSAASSPLVLADQKPAV
ncbi:hypothetical protein AMAG_11590 [Allomyces macrogynus ATCC 38327]|uniref:C2H2-type domain-containing protein n=1 Tax=Allomyces macrogynus (strain ATCC 38327) TaxID=578462 RepID=A0A0L0SV73_ALLM3|nr:hypothetical protein AMAG_11590 [Allomyces macrogynus ATCC 38327]|eukprot:KNE66453.1 hypothetical protein AMAG_11590 [Allomyces macrogynus ATCC 38327]